MAARRGCAIGWRCVVLLAATLAGTSAGCGGDDRASSSATPAAAVCAPTATRHEHELGAERRASIDAITVVHMERPGADATDARDTATAGVDEIPYVLHARATRRFGVRRGAVASATLRDDAGTTIVTVARGETSRPVDLAPGEYTLALVSDAAEDHIVAVAPDACSGRDASGSSEVATAAGGRRHTAIDRRIDDAAIAGVATRDATLAAPGVYVQEISGAETVIPIGTTTPAFIGATSAGSTGPRLVTSVADYTTAFGAPSAASFVSLAVAQYFANGGTAAWVVATSTSGAVPTVAELTSGLAMLDPIQGYFTIVLPDLARLDPADAATVAASAITYGAGNLSFVVLDAPTTLVTVDAVTGWVRDLTGAIPAGAASYAAVYFPPLASTVPGASTTVTTGSSGVVTGSYAATDVDVGVWQSPAGVVHGAVAPGATPISSVDDSDSATLVAGGVNPIRTLPGYGEVLWGARTLASLTATTDERYVATRRTLLMIEQSLRQSLQWAVFEPNDQTLWSAVTRQVSSFLTSLYAEGALFGATPSAAFYVVCDASNNPPETRALGILYVDVGVALVQPAEFVAIRVTQNTAGPDGG